MGFYTTLSSGSSGSSGLSDSELTRNLVNGNNTINHNLNASVKSVTVKNNAGMFIDTTITVVDSNNININVSGGGPINNAIINIFYL